MNPLAIVPKGGRGINSSSHVAGGRRGLCFARFSSRRTPWMYPMAISLKVSIGELACRKACGSSPGGCQSFRKAASGLNPFVILPERREGIYPLALAPEGSRGI